MGLIEKFTLMFIGNGVALYYAGVYLDNVDISLILEEFALAVALLTVANLFLRPIIRLALGPILLITFGLGSVLVNAVTIYLLDFMVSAVTITGLVALLLTAAVVTVVNLVLSLLSRFI